MCSLGTSATADAQLQSLQSSGDKEIIEKRLKEFAGDSQVDKPGILDSPANHLKEMPNDLRSMRRIRIGRHRVFYTGNYNQCSFKVFYIKTFKKKGVEDEADQPFQRLLTSVIGQPATKLLRGPDTPAPQTVPAPTKAKEPKPKRQKKRARGK